MRGFRTGDAVIVERGDRKLKGTVLRIFPKTFDLLIIDGGGNLHTVLASATQFDGVEHAKQWRGE